MSEQLISRMPEHEVYVEAFLGAGAVLGRKRPARFSIAIDRDPGRLERWRRPGGIDVVCADAIEWLGAWVPPRLALVYCDPPYLLSTRQSHRDYYQYDLADGDHERLLRVLCGLRCMVMVSGYRSALYSERLAGWRLETFSTSDRAGRRREECVWMNYPATDRLHDGRWVGADFRERERISRRRRNAVRRLAALPEWEWRELLDAVLYRRRSRDVASPPAGSRDCARADLE